MRAHARGDPRITRGTWCSPRSSPGCCWRPPARRRSWRARALAAALAGRSSRRAARRRRGARRGGARGRAPRRARRGPARVDARRARRVARGPARAAARPRRAAAAVARVRLLDGPGAGEQAVLRAGRDVAGARCAAAARRPVAPAGGRRRRRSSRGRVGAARASSTRISGGGTRTPRSTRAARVTPTGARRGGLAGALDSVRRRGERGLARGLAPPEAALLRGMVLGQDERLTEEVRDEFQRSGLAHILAVSGAERDAARRARPRRVRAGRRPAAFAAACSPAALIAVYVPLAGGGPSIQRAGVMGVAGLVAALAGRPARRWYALLLAAAATLALNPRAAGEPGWQLSFAAVVALLVGAAPLRAVLARRMPRRGRRGGRDHDRGDGRHRAADGALLPAGLARGAAREPARRAGDRAGHVARRARHRRGADRRAAGRAVHRARRAAARLHPAGRRITPGDAAVGRERERIAARDPRRLGAARRRRRRGAAALESHEPALDRTERRERGPTAAAVAAGAVAAVASRRARRGRASGGAAGAPPPGEVVVSFLDVGQGDATLVQRGGTSVLVDTGPPDGPIVERLRGGRDRAGSTRSILTHAEADHEGAAPAVVARVAPRLVVNGGAGWPSPRVQRALARRPRVARARRGRRDRARRPALRGPVAACRARRAGGRPATRTSTRSWPGSRPAGSRCCSPPTPRAA